MRMQTTDNQQWPNYDVTTTNVHVQHLEDGNVTLMPQDIIETHAYMLF